MKERHTCAYKEALVDFVKAVEQEGGFDEFDSETALALLENNSQYLFAAYQKAYALLYQEVTSPLIIYTDGACQSQQPGGVGTWGFSAVLGGQEIEARCQYVGEGEGITSNRMEYHAVLAALQWYHAQDFSCPVEIRMDSQLVCQQLNKEWKVRAGQLRELWGQVLTHAEAIPAGVTFTHIPREHNKRADQLANQAYTIHLSQHQADCVG